jgi:type IV pilus assembly protein PilV
MSSRNSGQRGFTLIEVMAALIVISIGLLGIAKMQALALSSTGNARTRSIAALEAASMAAMMHANLPYWSSFTSPTTFTITVTPNSSGASSSLSASGLTLPTMPSATCTYPGVSCTAAQLAAQDLSNWSKALYTALPTSTGTITCSGSSTTPAPGSPVTCTVELQWTENLVEVNTGMNTALTTSQNLSALQGGGSGSAVTTNGAATHFILFVDL